MDYGTVYVLSFTTRNFHTINLNKEKIKKKEISIINLKIYICHEFFQRKEFSLRVYILTINSTIDSIFNLSTVL